MYKYYTNPLQMYTNPNESNTNLYNIHVFCQLIIIHNCRKQHNSNNYHNTNIQILHKSIANVYESK